MTPWKISVQHELPPDEAVSRIHAGIDKIKPMLTDLRESRKIRDSKIFFASLSNCYNFIFITFYFSAEIF